jgi:Fe2+ or Zn2+ uptake regulation protein
MGRRQQSEEPKSATLLERLRQRGFQLTARRRVVAEALEGVHVHLTAGQIYDRAAVRLPEISRATFYNTLSQFCELSEVREITLDAGRSVMTRTPGSDTSIWSASIVAPFATWSLTAIFLCHRISDTASRSAILR